MANREPTINRKPNRQTTRKPMLAYASRRWAIGAHGILNRCPHRHSSWGACDHAAPDATDYYSHIGFAHSPRCWELTPGNELK